MADSRRRSTSRTKATTANKEYAGQLLLAFGLIVLVVYLLMFFTGGGGLKPKLGIDLQGGTRVTLTPQTLDGKSPSKGDLNTAKNIINNRVNGLGVAGSEVLVSGNNIVITVPGKNGAQARSVGQTAKLYVRPVVTAVAANPNAPTPPAVAHGDQTDAATISAARAARQAPKDPATSKGDDAQLTAADNKRLTDEMSQVNCNPGVSDPLQGNDDPDQFLVACGPKPSKDQPQQMVYLLAPKIISGTDVSKATASMNTQQGGQWVVEVDYKGDGAKTWERYTASHNEQRGAERTQTAVVLDTRVVSAASIREAIAGTTEISGNFSQSDAKNLANDLKYGSLPISFKQSNAETVSATLGLSALRAALLAGAIGLVLVLVYALAYYRMLGVLVLWSLVMSGVLVYGLMVLLGRYIGFTLDLAGMAGLIIGIGMTADSFVVYFERIKDEMREGRSFRSAVPRGWARARRTIWTGNAVTLIASAVLYFLSIADVKGFAFTLGLTTILDLVVVFLVTHPLVYFASKNDFLSRPSVNGLGGVSQIAQERRRRGDARRAGSAAGTGE